MSAETIAAAAAGDILSGRPARQDRPVRFEDPARDDAYWHRVDAIAATAPPLSDSQRAVIRTAFLGARAQEAAA